MILPAIGSRVRNHLVVRARRALITGVVLALASLALLLLTVATAHATQARIFSGAFGGEHSTVPDPYPLARPWSVGVDEATGDVYVTDPANYRVEEFAPTGDFLLMFGEKVNATAVKANGTEAEQDLCTAESGDTCQKGVPGAAPGDFEGEALYVAVDNSSGPSKNDVYVGSSVEDLLVGENQVQKFDSTGQLIGSWGTDGQLNGSTIASPPARLPGPFDQINGVAVDPSGNLWVYGTGDEQGRVFEFQQNAAFLQDWPTGTFTGSGIALNSEGDAYVTIGFHETAKYAANGTRLGKITTEGVNNEALTVDAANSDLYVATSPSPFNVLRFSPSCRMRPFEGGCEPEESFSSSHLAYSRGIAIDPASPGEVDPREPLYVAEQERGEVAGFSFEAVPEVLTRKASDFTSGAAMLNGTVNPSGLILNEGLAGCRFEWGEVAGVYGHVAECEQSAAEIGSGTIPVAVSAQISGLAAGHTYHFRLVAGNANDVNPGLEVDEPSMSGDSSFGPPLVESWSVSGVSATGAKLETAVSPNNVDTSVRIEYGTTPALGKETGIVDIGSGEALEHASWTVLGLIPDTTYYYRVVAHSVLGTVESEAHAFETQGEAAVGVPTLPDGRGWELVSPPDKYGAAIEPMVAELNFAIQAAASGDAVSYVTTAASELGAAGNANLSQVLSSRAGPGDGWQSQDISLPHSEASGVSLNSQEYRLFSGDLARGLLQPFGTFEAALSPEASEQTPYLRSDFAGGNPEALCADGCFRPLATSAAGFEDVTGGSKFGIAQNGGGTCPPRPECGPEVLGANVDLSDVVLSSTAPLLEGAPENGLYEWAGGKLTLVSILPSGKADAAANRPRLGQWEERSIVARNAISTDGSRIVWSDKNDTRLYLRDLETEETVELGKAGLFEDASSDDSTVFFDEEGHLKECQLVEEPGHLHCKTRELGSLEGTMIGASEDGSFAYFVSGTELELDHGNTVEPIAALSSEDYPDWAGTSSIEPLPHLTARVSPNGRWVAFMSQQELTGYDDHDAASGHLDEEVFLYHAAAVAGEQGSLVCVSCNPTGGRPHGVEFEQLEASGGHAGLAGGGSRVWRPDQWLAAAVPAWTSNLYQSRYLSNSGRLFFNSSDALVPQDTNNTEDVYEYEPPANPEAPTSDNCATTSQTFSTRSDGCVALISAGTSSEESAFLDASEDGDDVFFLTTARLAPQDVDRSLDVYDAHVCSLEAPCPAEPQPGPAPCEGDACQGGGLVPHDPTPGSLTFHGPENLPPPPPPPPPPAKPLTRAEKLTKALKLCRKDRRKRSRVSCERLARKRYPSAKKAKAKKATAGGSRAARARGRLG
jgi:hypothetical protein